MIIISAYINELSEMTWSFSRCHSFENCRYEWYLKYIEGGKSEQNFYAAFGKLCHEILEQILNNVLNRDSGLEFFKDNFGKYTEEIYVSESTKEKYYELGLRYFESLNLNWLDKYNILGIEKKCNFEIDGFKFVGYIDLLIQDKKTNEIIVIDHKSSEYPLGKKGAIKKKKLNDYDSYKNQLYIYSKPIIEEYGVQPTELWWNYFKEQQWLKLPFIESEYNNALNWASKLIEDIYDEEDFEAKIDYFYCKNLCGFRSTCEYQMMMRSD